MTPIEESKKLVPNADELTNEQLVTFRDLIDTQVDLILDSFMAEKAKQQKIGDDTIK